MLNPNEPFFLTYGDFLCNIELENFNDFHKKQGRALTVALIKQKNKNVFGGFMLVDIDAFDYILDEQIAFEGQPITKMAEDDEISWYYFQGKYEIIYQHMKIYEL